MKNETLTHKQVRPTCIYWANKFKSKQFEFNELYNVAYIIAIKQTTVLTLQKSIRGGLIRFMQNCQKFTSRCQPFENDNANSETENPLALCSKDKCLQSIINSEELLKIIEEAKLDQSEEFLTILRLRFVENLTHKEIAKKFNVTQQTFTIRFNTILNKLITVNKRRMSCPKLIQNTL